MGQSVDGLTPEQRQYMITQQARGDVEAAESISTQARNDMEAIQNLVGTILGALGGLLKGIFSKGGGKGGKGG